MICNSLETLEKWIDSLIPNIKPAQIIYLSGNLGAGKTTFTQILLKKLGVKGRVKSPTFTLVESYLGDYQNNIKSIHHFDLYRLADPEELYFLGVENYFEDPQHLSIIEWPEKAGSLLPSPDIILNINLNSDLSREYQLEFRGFKGVMDAD